MTLFEDTIKLSLLVLRDLVLEMDGLGPISVVCELSALTLDGELGATVFLARAREVALHGSMVIDKIGFFILELVSLFLDDFYLSIENELLSLNFKSLLLQVNESLVEVSAHLAVLVLQKTDVLVRGLLVVVEAADARLLLVLDHFLLQYFQFQLHEVDLLLQIDDVLVCVVDVWILAQGTRLRGALFLASEVHLGH